MGGYVEAIQISPVGSTVMPLEWLVSVGKEWISFPVSQSSSMAIRGWSFWSMTHMPSSVACIPLGCGQGVYQRSLAETRCVETVAVESEAVAVMSQPYNAQRVSPACEDGAIRRGNDLRHLGRQWGRGAGGAPAGVQLPGVPDAGGGQDGALDLFAGVTGSVASAADVHGLPHPLAVPGAAPGAVHVARRAVHNG